MGLRQCMGLRRRKGLRQCMGLRRRVYGNAEVSGDARVYGDAEVSGDAEVFNLIGFKLNITINKVNVSIGCELFTHAEIRKIKSHPELSKTEFRLFKQLYNTTIAYMKDKGVEVK